MKRKYNSELEAMQDFWVDLNIQPDYSCNTDGRYKGCLVEMKVVFTNVNDHKKQAVGYLSSFNTKALDLPGTILLIDINNRKYYEYNSYTQVWGMEKTWSIPEDFRSILDREECIKGWIDKGSLVEYNNKLCLENKNITSKEDVKNEFINPKILNIKPFDWNKNITEDWLRFNMNMLGPNLLKKQLGAFFTPDEYVNVSTQYVRNAIKNVPTGMDYIILDRCAGSGNLEKMLSQEELSHCILNTIDYTEWCTLQGLYKGRVRYIIPHTEKYRTGNGLLTDGDALAESFYHDSLTNIGESLLEYLKDKYVIVLENPPFSKPGAGTDTKSKGTGLKQGKSWVHKQLTEIYNSSQMTRQFVWSAVNVIKADELIIFAPLDYWKYESVINRECIEAHACNKAKFNASADLISLIHWGKKEQITDKIELHVDEETSVTSKQCYKLIRHLDRTDFHKVSWLSGVRINHSRLGQKRLALNVSNDKAILSGSEYKASEQMCIEDIPLFAAKYYSLYDPEMPWYKHACYYTNVERLDEALKDEQFMADCRLLFLLDSYKNRCISDSHKRNYAVLSSDSYPYEQDKSEHPYHKLHKLWLDILDKASNTSEYNPDYIYGMWQLNRDINIKVESGKLTKTGKPIMMIKYSELNEVIKQLKQELKNFYRSEIEPKLFEYELLK